jgi:hypothetical protein
MRYMGACLWLTLCMLAGEAGAAGTGTSIVYGAGNESCGTWLSSSTNQDIRNWQTSWVLGWLSASGHYQVLGRMKDTDAAAVTAWLDNYCKEHPLDELQEASAALIRELAKRGKSGA